MSTKCGPQIRRRKTKYDKFRQPSLSVALCRSRSLSHALHTHIHARTRALSLSVTETASGSPRHVCRRQRTKKKRTERARQDALSPPQTPPNPHLPPARVYAYVLANRLILVTVAAATRRGWNGELGSGSRDLEIFAGASSRAVQPLCNRYG